MEHGVKIPVLGSLPSAVSYSAFFFTDDRSLDHLLLASQPYLNISSYIMGLQCVSRVTKKLKYALLAI